MFIPKDDEYFTANVKVIVSNQFISWVFSLGNGVKIVGPDDVVEKVKSEVERLGKQYSD
jgi:predicted DNA-binding transcriptional regulator YafY